MNEISTTAAGIAVRIMVKIVDFGGRWQAQVWILALLLPDRRDVAYLPQPW